MTLARMEAGHLSSPYSRGVNGDASYGPMSLPSDLRGSTSRVPETEEEYQEYYQGKIYFSQSQQLYPLKEDLADWINKTLKVDYLTPENFLDMLDNGVIVCQLARVIQERAQQFISPSGSSKRSIPTIGGRLWNNASKGSFFARDNMQNFIQFCNKLGVHQNLLFESDDLVMHNRPRSVILCLLEVARLASRYNVEPPGLVQLEKEIAEEESHCQSDSGFSRSSCMSWQFHPSPTIASKYSHDKIKHSRSSSAISGGISRTPIGRPSSSNDRRSLMLIETNNGTDEETISHVKDLRRTASDGNTGLIASGGTSDGAPSDTMDDDWSRGSSEDMEADQDSRNGQPDQDISELDRRVQHATKAAQRQCRCPGAKCNKLKVKKVGEGKYNIAGRNVFIRLLKGRHMMVRVGGGWDTLEHFLLRHDPCQVRIVRRDSPTNKSTSPYLHIQAKYRSPTPADHVGR